MMLLELFAASNMAFMSCSPMLSFEKVLPLEARNCLKVLPETVAMMEISFWGISVKVRRTSPTRGSLGERPKYSMLPWVCTMVVGPPALWAEGFGSREKSFFCSSARCSSVILMSRGFAPEMDLTRNLGRR